MVWHIPVARLVYIKLQEQLSVAGLWWFNEDSEAQKREFLVTPSCPCWLTKDTPAIVCLANGFIILGTRRLRLSGRTWANVEKRREKSHYRIMSPLLYP